MPSIAELLFDAEKGQIHIPDFQRPWVWNKNRVRDLFTSPYARRCGAMDLPSGESLSFDHIGENIELEAHGHLSQGVLGQAVSGATKAWAAAKNR